MMAGQGGRQVPTPDMNHKAQAHEVLKGMTDAADPGGAQVVADEWAKMGAGFDEAAEVLVRAITNSESGYTGDAAAAMRLQLARVASWSKAAGARYTAAGESINTQSQVANSAKSQMPEPVPYDPAQMIKDASAGGLLAMASLPFEMYAQHQKSQAAHEEAARVVAERDLAYTLAAGQIPEFTAPPSLSDTGDGKADGRIEGKIDGPDGGDGRDSGGAGEVGGPGGSVDGSGGGSGPGTGPGDAPGGANPGGTTPGGFTPAPGVPGAPIGGGGVGPGGPSAGGGVVAPIAPVGGFAGGGPGPRGPGAGTGFGPRGGGGDHAGGGRPAGGRGPGVGIGPGAAAAQAAAGGRGVAGARGGAGMGGMPMGGARGQGGEDTEHQRPEYLLESDPESLFGTDEMTAPPVIGEE